MAFAQGPEQHWLNTLTNYIAFVGKSKFPEYGYFCLIKMSSFFQMKQLLLPPTSKFPDFQSEARSRATGEWNQLVGRLRDAEPPSLFFTPLGPWLQGVKSLPLCSFYLQTFRYVSQLLVISKMCNPFPVSKNHTRTLQQFLVLFLSESNRWN